MSINGIINHTGIIRGAVYGSGTLLIKAISFNNKKVVSAPNVTLDDDPSNVVSKTINFQAQLSQIEFRVGAINEWMNISTIVPFIKPVATSLPNG